MAASSPFHYAGANTFPASAAAPPPFEALVAASRDAVAASAFNADVAHRKLAELSRRLGAAELARLAAQAGWAARAARELSEAVAAELEAVAGEPSPFGAAPLHGKAMPAGVASASSPPEWFSCRGSIQRIPEGGCLRAAGEGGDHYRPPELLVPYTLVHGEERLEMLRRSREFVVLLCPLGIVVADPGARRVAEIRFPSSRFNPEDQVSPAVALPVHDPEDAAAPPMFALLFRIVEIGVRGEQGCYVTELVGPLGRPQSISRSHDDIVHIHCDVPNVLLTRSSPGGVELRELNGRGKVLCIHNGRADIPLDVFQPSPSRMLVLWGPPPFGAAFASQAPTSAPGAAHTLFNLVTEYKITETAILPSHCFISRLNCLGIFDDGARLLLLVGAGEEGFLDLATMEPVRGMDIADLVASLPPGPVRALRTKVFPLRHSFLLPRASEATSVLVSARGNIPWVNNDVDGDYFHTGIISNASGEARPILMCWAKGGYEVAIGNDTIVHLLGRK
jgi:hypothetical protein